MILAGNFQVLTRQNFDEDSENDIKNGQTMSHEIPPGHLISNVQYKDDSGKQKIMVLPNASLT